MQYIKVNNKKTSFDLLSMVPWWYEYVKAYVMLEVIDAKKRNITEQRTIESWSRFCLKIKV